MPLQTKAEAVNLFKYETGTTLHTHTWITDKNDRLSADQLHRYINILKQAKQRVMMRKQFGKMVSVALCLRGKLKMEKTAIVSLAILTRHGMICHGTAAFRH